jgi:hypothetical protein
MMRTISVSALLVAALTLFSGCTAAVFRSSPDPLPPALVDPPGIYEAPGGQARAVGIFEQIVIGEEVWAILGVADTESAESTVIVVVSNAETMGVNPARYRGRYVEVRGMLVEDESAHSPGPQFKASSIAVIVEDDPDDPLPPAP